MGEVISQIIEYLTGSIASLASGIGNGLQTAVTEMFMTTSETGAVTGLNAFGSVVIVFAGVALAVGLTTLVYNFFTNLGK